MTTERAPQRQTCTDHATCRDRCFHGLKAFDLHRQGGECLDPATVAIRNGARAGELALQVWTEEGYCDHLKGCWADGKRVKYEHPRTIYQVATTEVQREGLLRLRQLSRDALTGADGAVQARLGFA